MSNRVCWHECNLEHLDLCESWQFLEHSRVLWAPSAANSASSSRAGSQNHSGILHRLSARIACFQEL